MKNPRLAVGFIRYLRLLLRLRFGRLHHISVFHAVCNLIQKFRVVGHNAVRAVFNECFHLACLVDCPELAGDAVLVRVIDERLAAKEREPIHIRNLQNVVFHRAEVAIHKVTQKDFQNFEDTCGAVDFAVVHVGVEIIEVIADIAVERADNDFVEHIILFHKRAKLLRRVFADRAFVLDFDDIAILFARIFRRDNNFFQRNDA